MILALYSRTLYNGFALIKPLLFLKHIQVCLHLGTYHTNASNYLAVTLLYTYTYYL